MKKAIVAIAIAAFASTATADIIENSPHDLHLGFPGVAPRVNAPLASCQFCHTPHNANTAAPFDFVPLWNRVAPASGTYLVKNTATNQAPALGGRSLTCLSCHDGSADIGQTFSSTAAFQVSPYSLPAAGIANPGSNIGATYDGSAYAEGAVPDLRDDHPVGINLVVSQYYNSAAAVTAAGLNLYNGDDIECATCHEPHDNQFGQFLRVDPAAGKGICGTCHNK